MLYWSLKPLCCKKNSNLKSWPNRHHKSKVKYEALAIKYWCPHFKNLQKKNCKNHTKDLFEKKMLSRWIETCLMFNFYKRKLLVCTSCSKLNRVNVVLGTYIYRIKFSRGWNKKKCANFLKPEISKALRNDNEWGEHKSVFTVWMAKFTFRANTRVCCES